MENNRCDVDEKHWPDQQERHDVHQESFFSMEQISDFCYKSLISMVDCHGEKTTKHFDQCGSHDDKNT